MSWHPVWTYNSVKELQDIVVFEEKRQLGRGKTVADSIFSGVDTVTANPEIAPPHPLSEDPRIRRFVLKKYIVIYRMVSEGMILQILSVRHQRQQPADLALLP